MMGKVIHGIPVIILLAVIGYSSLGLAKKDIRYMGLGPLTCKVLSGKDLEAAEFILRATIVEADIKDGDVWQILIRPTEIWKGESAKMPQILDVEHYIETQSDNIKLQNDLTPDKEYIFFLNADISNLHATGNYATGKCNPYFDVNSKDVQFLKLMPSKMIN